MALRVSLVVLLAVGTSAQCSDKSSCASCASILGCTWLATSSAVGASGTCAVTGSPFNFLTYTNLYPGPLSGACPTASVDCNSFTSCSSCASTSGCQWASMTNIFGAAAVCLATTVPTLPIAYPFLYTSASSCPILASCSTYTDCSGCTSANCYWFSNDNSNSGSGACYTPKPTSTTYKYGYQYSFQCPSLLNLNRGTGAQASTLTSGSATTNTDYVPQINAGVTAFAIVCAVLVGGGLIAFIVLRNVHTPKTTPTNPAEANVTLIFRIGIVQIILGLVGLAASFAYVSSILTLASGVVVLVTLRDLGSTLEIVQRRKSACSHPLHAANLAIAAIVFACIDLLINVALKFVVVVIIVLFQSWCAGTWSPTALNSYNVYIGGSDVCNTYAPPMAVIAVYITNAITVAVLCVVANIALLAVYSQVMGQLGSTAVLCGCGRGPKQTSGDVAVAINGDSNQAYAPTTQGSSFSVANPMPLPAAQRKLEPDPAINQI